MWIRPPSVTGIVDRLEKMRLIVRRASTTDLRAKEVALTDEGRRLVEKVLQVHDGQITRVMSGLGQKEQEDLYRLLSRLGEHFECMADSRDYQPAAVMHEASLMGARRAERPAPG